MKAILALLFGLYSSTFARRIEDSVVLEFESPDSAEQASDVGEGSSQSYNGIIIQVRQGQNESPTIALGSDIDDYDDVYCLNFVGMFEASEYDTTTTTNGEYTEIDGTRIDLADANCVTEGLTETVFNIQCNQVGDATLTLTFAFTQDEQDDYGLEYIINLDGYTLSDNTAKLVMVQSLDECGDLIDIDAESEEEEDTPETTEADSTETTDTDNNGTPDDNDEIVAEGGNRRRLLQTTTDSTEEDETPEPTETDSTDEEDTETDQESIDEGDGISEDDSGEFDSGFARFVVNGQALDVCGENDQTEIGSTLVHQEDDDELHIVFDSFSCTLVLDPFYGLDESKYEKVYGSPSTTDDNAYSFNIYIASIIGLIAYLW